MNPVLLVVDDDGRAREMVGDYLANQGMTIRQADSGAQARALLAAETVDLVILDIMMPGEDGFSVARGLRQAGYEQPLLMLSACAEEIDKVAGLEVGADAYLTKPVRLRELLAQVRALLRRAPSKTPPPGDVLYQVDDLVVNSVQRSVCRNGQPLPLTAAEFRLLLALIQAAPGAVSRDQLSRVLSGQAHAPYDRAVDVHIRHLRQKIEPDPAKPKLLQTVRGKGYCIAERPVASPAP